MVLAAVRADPDRDGVRQGDLKAEPPSGAVRATERPVVVLDPEADRLGQTPAARHQPADLGVTHVEHEVLGLLPGDARLLARALEEGERLGVQVPGENELADVRAAARGEPLGAQLAAAVVASELGRQGGGDRVTPQLALVEPVLGQGLLHLLAHGRADGEGEHGAGPQAHHRLLDRGRSSGARRPGPSSPLPGGGR